MDGFWDDLTKAGKSVLGAVDEKGAKLEGALKLIILLSGIAAATGVVNVFLRRR